MASEIIGLGAASVGAATYLAKQVLGPTLTSMGNDLEKVWAIGRQRIIERAAAKTPNLDDGKTANLRVTRDVIWNGAVTDDEVCAEYFGGILAACRSEDGQDDSAMQFVDCIKSMSAKQLHLHYAIYRSLQVIWIRDGKQLNPGQQAELAATTITFPVHELVSLGIDPTVDLTVLKRQSLIDTWKVDLHLHSDGNHGFLYAQASPSTFGVLLYAIAMNRLKEWSSMPVLQFDGNEAIATPLHFDPTPEKLFGLLMKHQDNEELGG